MATTTKSALIIGILLVIGIYIASTVYSSYAFNQRMAAINQSLSAIELRKSNSQVTALEAISAAIASNTTTETVAASSGITGDAVQQAAADAAAQQAATQTVAQIAEQAAADRSAALAAAALRPRQTAAS